MQMKFLTPVLLAALLVGCNSGKSPSQKQKALKHWNSARANVLCSLAKDQYATGNFDKSRQTVQEALSFDPDNVGLRILSAKLAIEQGQLELADAELKRTRALAPHYAEADYLSGTVYQRWQKPEIACQYYTDACDKNPGELAYLLARAEMLVSMDRSPEALSLLQEKVIYFEHSPVIRDAVGQLLVQQGRYREAVDMLRQASILASTDLTIKEHLSFALYYNKQYREAADAITKLVKSEQYSERADLYAALGESRMQLGQYREARSAFETATEMNPGSAPLWLSHAKAALQLSDTRRANLSLRKALSLNPESSEGYLMLGYMRMREDNLPEALPAFQKASALDASDTVSLCMIGHVLEKMGKSDDALQYYGKALKLKPHDELAVKMMASIDLQN
jgi:tetratricopeptide (TPR) repeat protein